MLRHGQCKERESGTTAGMPGICGGHMTIRQWTIRTAALAFVAGLGWAVAAPAAHACGGFFCNNQGIDQSGENILFIRHEDGTVSTVVQIQYSGPSEEFAWILPVPAEPSVGVGTNALFQALNLATQPRFTTEFERVGRCREVPMCAGNSWTDVFNRGGRGGFAESDDLAAAGAVDPDQREEPPGVDVRFRANVGPYDAAVLSAGDGDALRDWLRDNGYLIPDEAGAELDHYVDLDHFFVALRLQKDQEAGDIQPIVLRSNNDEPCIPIRLTRIATVPDMPITAYFLGTERARPTNYMLVNVDLDDFAFWEFGRDYRSAVTETVDDAGGHAFVTDFAGPVPEIQVAMDPIDDMRDITDAGEFVRELVERGFNGDAQLLGILSGFIPAPEGLEGNEQAFYNCLTNEWCDEYDTYAAELSFDQLGLVEALTEGIIEPRQEAQDMLDEQPHLTRLFTTMSADEMNEDPMFGTSTELEQNVPANHVAIMRTECGPGYFEWNAPRNWILPSGQTRVIQEGVEYYGSDREYCQDYESGFRPGSSTDTLREIAARRSLSPRGGCGVDRRPAQGGALAGLALLGLFGFAFMRRRRSR